MQITFNDLHAVVDIVRCENEFSLNKKVNLLYGLSDIEELNNKVRLSSD